MKDPSQLELPLSTRPKLTLLKGDGQRKQEPLDSRDAVARVLIEAGADLLLKRISCARAEYIEERVEAVLVLFDRVDHEPAAMAELKARLDELEALMRETRESRVRRRM
jgi:hypothetical protein